MIPEQLTKRFRSLRIGTTGTGGGGGSDTTLTRFISYHSLAQGADTTGDHLTASGATDMSQVDVLMNGIDLLPADYTDNLDGTITLATPVARAEGATIKIVSWELV